LLGENGSGKASVFEMLYRLGKAVDSGAIFYDDTFTRWSCDTTQTFELVVETGAGHDNADSNLFRYRLVLNNQESDEHSIAEEELLWNGKRIYFFDGRNVHLFLIKPDTHEPEQSHCFPVENSLALMYQYAGSDDSLINVFRRELRKCMIVCPNPFCVSSSAATGTRYLNPLCDDFANWFYNLVLKEPVIVESANSVLRCMIHGFQRLFFKKHGGGHQLHADFGDYSLDFSHLSHGERTAILLCTLSAYALETRSTLLIHDSENYLSSQSFARVMEELTRIKDMPGMQIVLASHRTEIVERSGWHNAVRLSRPDGKNTAIQPYD